MKNEHGYHLAAPSALFLSLVIALAALYVASLQHASSGANSIDVGALAPDGVEVGLPAGLADVQQNQPKSPVGRYVQKLGEAVERE